MKKLKLRFIDDFSYPVTVLEDPYFEYQLGLCPGGLEDWKKLWKGIRDEYDGDEEAFLHDFYAAREAMIQDLRESKAWEEVDMEKFRIEGKPETRTKDIYNQEYADKDRIFMSVDLTKANIQAFATVDPERFGYDGKDVETFWSADDLWHYFVRKHVADKKVLGWYCLKSKYLRQVVFGNVNAKRQITIEKWLVWEQAKELMKAYPDAKLVMASADEVVFELEKKPDTYVPRVRVADTKIRPFKLSSIPFETGSGVTIRVYKREFLSGEYDYKCIPRNYYPQIWCLLEKGEECKEEGLVFYYEKEIAKFLRRLKRKEEI